MGKAAKKIIDGLVKAKVSKADQARSKDLIDEAHDWDDKQAAEVEAVVRYACGVGELPKKISADTLEHRCSDLLRGMSKKRELDAWDTRALEVLAQCKKYYWFWELDSWARDRVEKFPAEPIFEEMLPVFRSHGIWPDDNAIIESMVNHLSCHVTKKGELTSTGRWLCAKLDDDADAVFEIARKQKDDETSTLYRLLLAHRRELFEKLLPKLKLKKDSDKSFLAEVMLEADAKRYEKQAVALMANLKDGIPAVLSALNLEKFFPGKYKAEVKRLLIATMKTKRQILMMTEGADDTKELAYQNAWKWIGDDAIDVWKAFEEENDAIRLEFFATIEKQAKAKALPFLIDGLVYPKDPNAEYGFVTHAKYVARMLEILKPYDLTPHHARIEKTFAKTKDKKIRELIDRVLGAKPAKGKAKPKTKPFEGKQGYRMEAYVDAVTKAALAATKKVKKMPSPIESVKLGGFQGEIQLNALLIEGVGDPVTLQLSIGKTKVPPHCDFTDDDNVLPAFAKLHALDGEEMPSWGDMYKLPWCVLLHEQIAAMGVIAAGLKAQGHTLAKKCKLGVGEDDNFWESTASFERMSRSEVKAMPEAQQADFAAVCFEDAKKQKWLLAKKG